MTDNKGKLVGVVTRIDLVNLAKFKLGADLSIDALRKFLLASSVRDVIHPYSWKSGVTPEDSIIRALDIIIQHDLIDIPVIDKKGRILGDLKLSEVLLKAIS
ncbi:MAG: CBS domain-containing protein [Thaumarchaeota archaeon]|nr:CBS domain-containing protein [Nitrososphaerota archaeon]